MESRLWHCSCPPNSECKYFIEILHVSFSHHYLNSSLKLSEKHHSVTRQRRISSWELQWSCWRLLFCYHDSGSNNSGKHSAKFNSMWKATWKKACLGPELCHLLFSCSLFYFFKVCKLIQADIQRSNSTKNL